MGIPSRNSSSSMPLGNGHIGLNVWIEEDGDLLFYISKTDAWSENARLLKLGRVRVKFSPNPFSKGMLFSQTLRLREAEIAIRAGNSESPLDLRLWVDANEPVIRVEAVAKHSFDLTAVLETWRKTERNLEGKELQSAYGLE
ncbi:MAG: DUF5703 domain-containing protein [Acidobacteriota bacterium]